MSGRQTLSHANDFFDAQRNNDFSNRQDIYQNSELVKLLEKARGTAYEEALKKVVEMKLGTSQRNDILPSKQQYERKIVGDILPRRSSSPVARDKSRERRLWLSDMSQPLDRNKWKVSEESFTAAGPLFLFPDCRILFLHCCL